MKAIMVMFDTLIRNMLPPYGCDWVHAPNFSRLAEKSVVFDNCYIGSMPCMPARRELHTGRYNFLHSSWGPIEPYDDSMPEILKNNGVYTHLVSDHYHYWEDGGCTYHTRYNTWEIVRGQEGDAWKGEVGSPELPPTRNLTEPWSWKRQDWINRKYMPEEKDHSQTLTFRYGLEFIERNHGEDNWFLQIEAFDPHEPFFTYEQYLSLYPHEYEGSHFDWPPYGELHEDEKTVNHIRCQYAALLSMCDHNLGKVLDMMDKHNLWKDTMLIVNTDHGYLLGEHSWWAKSSMPSYNEIAHTPLFIWNPSIGVKGERRGALVQTIDLAPTLLDYFGVNIPPNMQGKPLADTIRRDEPIREGALFGLFGAHVCCCDGRFVYMRAPALPGNGSLYEYRLMPTCHGDGRAFISMEELATMQLSKPFSFTKGLRLMKIKSKGWHGIDYHPFGNLLFDLKNDPKQENPISNPEEERRMTALMCRLMEENDAPPEQYERLGIPC